MARARKRSNAKPSLVPATAKKDIAIGELRRSRLASLGTIANIRYPIHTVPTCISHVGPNPQIPRAVAGSAAGCCLSPSQSYLVLDTAIFLDDSFAASDIEPSYEGMASPDQYRATESNT